jgi:hypothetical protein
MLAIRLRRAAELTPAWEVLVLIANIANSNAAPLVLKNDW